VNAATQPAQLDERWDEVRGHRVRTLVGGKRRRRVPIVLVHGLGVAAESLRDFAAELAEGHPVFAPDLPGFGESDHPRRALAIAGLADALRAWLDAVGLRRVVLVGNSIGAQVVAEAAASGDERVAGAVLVGPTCDPAARSIPAQVWRWMINARSDTASRGGGMVDAYLKAGILRVVKTFHYATRHRIEDKLPRISVPTLLVGGGDDPISPLHWVERLAELAPDGRMAVIPDATHSMHGNQPEELARIVREFIAEAQIRAVRASA
jgi:2-hydroxy-6-oxonona-2,4-dienedioate hydrolase